MNFIKKTLPVLALGIILSGCASTQNRQNPQELPSKISFAPAIDVSYEEVSANIDQNIGTDVRWGGQVIESEALDKSTVRLTIFAHPLSNTGRPVKTEKVDDQGGRFIVDLTNDFAKDAKFDGHFLTIYGSVVSRLKLTNGNRQKSFPVINAQELVDWNIVDNDSDSHRQTNRHRGHIYYGLGYGRGHYGYRSGYGFPYSFGISRHGYSGGFFFKNYRSYGHRGYRSRGHRVRGHRSRSHRSRRH